MATLYRTLTTCALLLCLSSGAYAVTASFDLDGNGTLESSAVSTATSAVPFVCTPCTVTYTVNDGIATAQTFDWTGAGFKGKVNGSASAVWSFTTFQGTIQDTGNISFMPAGVAGPADYDKPVKSAIVAGVGDLISLFSKSPVNIEFKSSFTQLGPNAFQYTDTVTNFLSSPISFEWSAADFAGTVLGNDQVSKTFFSSSPPLELFGPTIFDIAGDQYSGPAHAWAPVPEPASLVLLGSGLVGLMWLRKRCRKR